MKHFTLSAYGLSFLVCLNHIYGMDVQNDHVYEIHLSSNDLPAMDDFPFIDGQDLRNDQLEQKLSELRIETPLGKIQAEKILSKVSEEHYVTFLNTYTDLMKDIEDNYQIEILGALYSVAPSLYTSFLKEIQSLCSRVGIKHKTNLIQIYSYVNPKLYIFLSYFFENNKMFLDYVPTVNILLHLEGITQSQYLSVPIGVFYQEECPELMNEEQIKSLLLKLHNTYYSYAPQGTPPTLLFQNLNKKNENHDISEFSDIVQKMDLNSLSQAQLKNFFLKLNTALFTNEFIKAVQDLSEGLLPFDKRHIVHAFKNVPSQSISNDHVLCIKRLTKQLPALKRALVISGLTKLHPSLLPVVEKFIDMNPSFFDQICAESFNYMVSAEMTESDLLEALECLRSNLD